jgi:hypothetical protein
MQWHIMDKKLNVTIRMDKKTREKYQEFCKKNNMVFSKRIRALIEKDLKGEIK